MRRIAKRMTAAFLAAVMIVTSTPMVTLAQELTVPVQKKLQEEAASQAEEAEPEDTQESEETPAEKPGDTEEPGETPTEEPGDTQEPGETPAEKPGDAGEPGETPAGEPEDTEEPGETPTEEPEDTQESEETPAEEPEDTEEPEEISGEDMDKPEEALENEEDAAEDDLVWSIKEDCLVISGSGKMRDYKQDEETPWKEIDGSYMLTIEEGITYLGANAFRDCTWLTEDLLLPETLTGIGANCFAGCSGASGKVYLPESVKSIGKNAFPKDIFHEIYGVEGSYAEEWAAENGITFIPKLLFSDEEEMQLLELQIAAVDSQVYAVSSIDTEDFEAKYGLSYEDLLFRCPEYLENEVMQNYLDKRFLYAGDVWGDALVDEKTAKWMYNLKQGMSYNVKTVLGDVGITESEHEKFQIEMAKQVVKDYLSTDTASSGMFREVADNLSTVNKVYDVVNDNTDYIEAMAKGCEKLSESEIKEIVNAIKTAEPVTEYIGDLETMFKLSSAVIAMEEIDLYAVDVLIESQEIKTKDNDLYEGLCLLREQLQKDPAAYVLSNYCTDKMIASLASSLEGIAADALFGAGAYTVIKTLAKGVAGIYELFNPSYEQINYATTCFMYYSDASYRVELWRNKFKKASKVNERDEILYEAAYQMMISCLRVFLKNAAGCTRDKSIIRTLNTYYEGMAGNDMYAAYIALCMQEASKALKNGTLELKDVEVVRKTSDGTVIDENYDSKESIAARFAVIQAQYVPNVGQTWTDNWGGAIQCFGFARMVFYNLFGCNMPAQYYGSARYAYAQENNVTLTGQLVGEEVTQESVKSLFGQGSLGDIVQGYGTPYGQHTSVLAGVTDDGISLYYCNETGECGLYQKSYTWSQLVSRYGTGDSTSDNGISLYHASNYASIYGDGSDLFYDDSVNFVITDGVLTKYNGWQKLVKIPDTVTSIGSSAFKNNTTMISVEIPDSVTSIGDSAFYGCTALMGVIIPDSVESVGQYCFYGCTSLKNAQLPENEKFTTINSYTFYNAGLTAVEIPEGVTLIGSYAFYACNSLKKVAFPSSLLTVGDRSFFGTALESIDISDNVTTIDIAAFGNCKKLEKVDLPKHLQYLKGNTFINCVSLRSIEIPKSLQSASVSWIFDVSNCGSGEFRGCTSLKEVTFEEGTTKVAQMLFYCAPAIEKIEIPEGVTSIGGSAFFSCSALKKVIFPSSLVTIGGSSFFGTALETVDISDNVTSIGCAAFGNCKKLEKVDLPKQLRYLQGNTFINCVSLKSIEIPKSLQSASVSWIFDVSNSGSGEFRGCTSLKEVSFEEGTTKVAQMLFYCAPAIETITIPESVTLVEKQAFYYCTSLREIVFENAGNMKEIQDSAFRGTAIKEIEIPTVGSLGTYVFAECSALEKVTLPENWIRLMQGTFYQCGKLDTVVMSPQMQEIRREAFNGCKSLQNIELPDTLLTVRDSAFYNCDSLTSLSLPSGMTTIEQKAFYDCDGLLDVTVPDSVTSMGDYAFYHCNSLKDVSLGTGITVIPQYAFANCGKIEEITLPYRVTTINAYAFNADTSLTKIMIPRNVTSIATTAFSYPDKMTIYGISGTYAETFADANGYPFVSNEIPAEEITVTPAELTVNKGYYKRLSLKVAPSDFTDKVTFKSANTEIATVDSDGKVTGVSVGNTTVKVIVGSLSKSIKVTVNQPVTGIYVYPYSKEMEAGDELELEIDVYPDTATNKAYQLKSSDSTVASVSEDGVVKALKKGTARITATALDGSGKSDYCDITVLNNLYQVQGTEGFESAHPYGDNCKDIWEYQNPEAEKIKITFSKDTEVEEDFDFIKIYGPEKKLIGTYTGTALAGKSIEVEGSVVYVQLVSDDAGSAYGFKVTEICVNGQEIPVKAISLDTTQLTLAKGEHRTLTVKYTPENTTADRTVVWSSSNEAVAGVDENGVVTALSAGTAVITAKVGKLSAKAAVTVTAAMTGIAFEKTELTLLLGDSYALTALPVPADTTDDAGVTYQSSAPDIVSVDENGVLFARKKGSAVITAASVFKPEYTASCEVTVVCSTVTFDSQGGSEIAPIECSSGAMLVLSDKVPEREGYQFTGWYKDSACTLAWDEAADVVTEDITLYAGWEEIKEDFWVMELPAQTYTGKAIKPQVIAYDGNRQLVQKKDYSVSYKNNINVYEGDEEAKKPQVIVKGLGNYTGTKIITFEICPKALSDEDIRIADIYKAVNGKEQKAYPTVMWGKKKLTYNKNEAKSNYLLTYPEGDYVNAGEHEVTVTGRGNYCGQTSFTLVLTDRKLISKAAVKYQKNLVWQKGEPVKQTALVVKMGGKALQEGTDYAVSYENNSEIGTAVLFLKGLGDYAGEKRITYHITGQKLSAAKISGIVDKEYTGEPVYQKYSLTYGGDNLVLHEDYEVVYRKNVSAGTATMIFTGIGGYTGTVKKTFRITPYSVKTNELGAFEDQSGIIEAVYEKGGVKPSVSLTFHGRALKEGEDYTLSYKNNGAVNDGTNEKKLPTILIKGKGNFKDSISRTFTILPADIGAEGNRMQAQDVVFKNKKNAYKTKPVIYDAFGKKLAAGKDYDKNLRFRYDDAQGAQIGASELPQAGSVIYVEAQGIGNYAGSCIGTTYRIAEKSIKSAKATVNAQTYTGNPVTITKDDITRLAVGKDILSQEDYEILEGTYVNNIKKGTAKVTIRGLGDYGCEKQITFKITAKSIQ